MSLPKIVLETEKTMPVYGLPLRIRQGDKGDVLEVLLGKSFTTYPNLTDIPVTLMAERSDQTLVKAAATTKVDNTFSVTLPDAMYAKVGVFRRVYFKVGDDSTSDIKVEVLSGTGSSSANGNYIQDFEDLLAEAMSYVYALNSLAGTYDVVIDNKITELTAKMTDFVTQAGKDLDAAKKAYAESQTQSETDAKNQRTGFDTQFGKLVDADKAAFKTLTDDYAAKVKAADVLNTSNKDRFDKQHTDNETAFTAQNKDFESRYVAQKSDFEKRYNTQKTGFDTDFQAKLKSLQTDYDKFKGLLENDVSDVQGKLKALGTNVSDLEAKATAISDKLKDVDLSQMQTNKSDIATLRKDLTTTDGKFADYTNTSALNTKLEPYEKTSDVSAKLANYSPTTEIEKMKTEIKSYADQKIAGLINGAPQDMDTLKELSDLMKSNDTAMDTLNDAVGKKVDKDTLTSTLASYGEKPVVLSQTEYDALPTKEDKFYVIKEDAQ